MNSTAASGARAVIPAAVSGRHVLARWSLGLALVLGLAGTEAAQVQHLNTQSATASGAGAAGTPSIASFNIPSGKNRALFIWVSFERDHCSDADNTGGLCTDGNVAGTGLGDNYPEPRVGTPPATTTNSQLTARVRRCSAASPANGKNP
jgi:hypothetical protein